MTEIDFIKKQANCNREKAIFEQYYSTNASNLKNKALQETARTTICKRRDTIASKLELRTTTRTIKLIKVKTGAGYWYYFSFSSGCVLVECLTINAL